MGTHSHRGDRIRRLARRGGGGRFADSPLRCSPPAARPARRCMLARPAPLIVVRPRWTAALATVVSLAALTCPHRHARCTRDGDHAHLETAGHEHAAGLRRARRTTKATPSTPTTKRPPMLDHGDTTRASPPTRGTTTRRQAFRRGGNGSTTATAPPPATILRRPTAAYAPAPADHRRVALSTHADHRGSARAPDPDPEDPPSTDPIISLDDPRVTVAQRAIALRLIDEARTA